LVQSATFAFTTINYYVCKQNYKLAIFYFTSVAQLGEIDPNSILSLTQYCSK